MQNQEPFRGYLLILLCLGSFMLGAIVYGILALKDSTQWISALATTFAAIGTVGTLLQMKKEQHSLRRRLEIQEQHQKVMQDVNLLSQDIENYNHTLLSLYNHFIKLSAELYSLFNLFQTLPSFQDQPASFVRIINDDSIPPHHKQQVFINSVNSFISTLDKTKMVELGHYLNHIPTLTDGTLPEIPTEESLKHQLYVSKYVFSSDYCRDIVVTAIQNLDSSLQCKGANQLFHRKLQFFRSREEQLMDAFQEIKKGKEQEIEVTQDSIFHLLTTHTKYLTDISSDIHLLYLAIGILHKDIGNPLMQRQHNLEQINGKNLGISQIFSFHEPNIDYVRLLIPNVIKEMDEELHTKPTNEDK